MNYQLITTDAQLQVVCKNALQVPAVALDTEFVRIRTYYPHIGLIQLYDGETVSLIDPLAITDFSPFIALLSEPSVTKYLHACSEDLEVFLHYFKCCPQPMIDTQIVAAFLGHPISCGFATLVEHYCEIILDKSESRTDWLARPLTQKQYLYAAADVFYLLPLAQKLMGELSETSYHDALQEECQKMISRRQHIAEPKNAYTSFSHASQLYPNQLACLQLLAQWRLEQARERDLAVNFVVKEEHLWKVARYLPTSLQELEYLGLTEQEIRCHGRRLLYFVEHAKALPENVYPPAIINLNDHIGYRHAFKEIKTLINTVGEKETFNTALLASRKQINHVLKQHWSLTSSSIEPDLVTGWRGKRLKSAITRILEKY